MADSERIMLYKFFFKKVDRGNGWVNQEPEMLMRLRVAGYDVLVAQNQVHQTGKITCRQEDWQPEYGEGEWRSKGLQPHSASKKQGTTFSGCIVGYLTRDMPFELPERPTAHLDSNMFHKGVPNSLEQPYFDRRQHVGTSE